jgi:hypothetical protein
MSTGQVELQDILEKVLENTRLVKASIEAKYQSSLQGILFWEVGA